VKTRAWYNANMKKAMVRRLPTDPGMLLVRAYPGILPGQAVVFLKTFTVRKHYQEN